MSKTETAAQAVTVADPVAAATAVLFDKAAAAPDQKKARETLSALADGRPWEQLPSAVKSACRADAKRLLGADLRGPAKLVDAGYSAAAAGRILRDIGRA